MGRNGHAVRPGVGVWLFQDCLIDEVRYIIDHSDTRFLFGEGQEEVDKAISIFNECPKLEKIIWDDPKGMRNYDQDYLISLKEVQQLGRELEKEKPDLVAIGPRWTINHKDYLLACADIGAHGFMEKHICVDLEEADEMIAAVEAKNLKWSLAYNFRVTPEVQHARHMFRKEGIIGSPLEMRARGKEGKHERRGGR